jgi:NAD(P)H dehydrogenase (quinone)
MRVLYVYCHPLGDSFHAAIRKEALAGLAEAGHEIDLLDLYAEGFDPVLTAERRRDYHDPERNRANNQAYVDRLMAAKALVVQFPTWSFGPPAMLKGWFDRVLVYGAAYTSKKRFEKGRFAGKRAMLSVTVGTSRATYEHDGRSGDIDLMLWPVNFTLTYVGYEIVAPYVSYGVEAGLRYSDPAAIEDRLKAVVADFRARIPRLAEREIVPFNRMEEWGPDGRIAPWAPVHSAFVRRKKRLELE